MPKSYFPPATLKGALCIPRTIFEKNAGNPMFRITLATELDLKPEGEAFRKLITASAGYGLTTGSYRAEKIELGQRGGDAVRGDLNTVYEILFSVELFQRFYEYFATGGSKSIPSEKAAKDFLKDQCGVPDRQVNAILAGILENARDWYLIQAIAGVERFVPRELAMQVAQQSSEPMLPKTTPTEPLAPEIPVSEGRAEHARSSVVVEPRLQLNIEIHIDPNTPDEKVETIFKNMKRYLLTNE